MFEWRIIRIKASPAAIIGHVNAPDAEQAIKVSGFCVLPGDNVPPFFRPYC
jgi:hypothetical protein